ncbi:MAG: SoxR reducing system RseC family protein [Bacteroidota bacterium]|nr:SoxR reducing system RseC family protein [Bacteroidota bacterium]
MNREKKEDCNTSEARVLSIEGNKISLMVEQKESCTACAAASLCEKTSKSGKNLDIIQANAKDFYVGEKVLLNVPQSKIYKAISLAFVYPLLIIAMICLLGSYCLKVQDTLVVLACIVGIATYYLTLYFCRHKKYFNFSLFITKIV